MASSAAEAVIHYDAEVDVLYITIKESEDAVSYEVEEGLVLRLDPETDELVGATIMGMREVAEEIGLKGNL